MHSLHSSCVCAAHRHPRHHSISWNWCSRWLSAYVWVLESSPGLCKRNKSHKLMSHLSNPQNESVWCTNRVYHQWKWVVSLRMFTNFLGLGHFDTLKSREHRGSTKSNRRLGMLVHNFNPCNHEAEAGCSLSVQEHPGLYFFEGWGEARNLCTKQKCGGQRIMYIGVSFLISGSGIKFKLSVMLASAFIHLAITLALWFTLGLKFCSTHTHHQHHPHHHHQTRERVTEREGISCAWILCYDLGDWLTFGMGYGLVSRKLSVVGLNGYHYFWNQFWVVSFPVYQHVRSNRPLPQTKLPCLLSLLQLLQGKSVS